MLFMEKTNDNEKKEKKKTLKKYKSLLGKRIEIFFTRTNVPICR